MVLHATNVQDAADRLGTLMVRDFLSAQKVEKHDITFNEGHYPPAQPVDVNNYGTIAGNNRGAIFQIRTYECSIPILESLLPTILS